MEARDIEEAEPQTYLVDSLVVDSDQVAGRGVDLEGLVEGEGGVEGLSRVGGQLLADLDVLHEVGLALVDAGGEALLLGGVDGLLDVLDALLAGGRLVLLLVAHLAALVAPQRAAELGRLPALVVEVDGVS